MPRISNSAQNVTLLEAALEGLQLQRNRIEEQIAEVRRLLGRHSTSAARRSRSQSASTAGPRGRKPLSAAARKRIAAAQKRRWAEYRKQSGGTEEHARTAAANRKAGSAKKS